MTHTLKIKQLLSDSAINLELTLFWFGKEIDFVKWETMDLGGDVVIKIKKRKGFILTNISELSNKNKTNQS